MFSFLKNVISSFWSENDADLSLDEAYNILNSAEDKEDVELPNEISHSDDIQDDYACYHKTGTVTAANDGSYTIDDTYEFKSQLENLGVGMQVSFTVYTTNGEVKVSDVAIKDDWNCSMYNVRSSWTSRTLICKVSKREGRQLIATPGDISIDLNSITSEFIPIVGDWIELQAKVELDQNITDLFGKVLEIERICALRPRVLEGCVKEWCNETKTGVIDRVVYFNGDTLTSGYVPVVGDKVIIEAIESDQGRYTCRALKVIPEKQVDKQLTLTSDISCKFEDNKEGIYISDNIFLNAVKLGRWITVNLESNRCKIDRAKNVNKGSFLLANSKFKLKRSELVRGQYLTVPPRFISARLPDYPVPQKLYNIFVQHADEKNDAQLKEDICKAKPCLSMSLSFNIYEDYFHTLLHLDEIQHLIALKNYEQDRVLFIRNAEYLMVEIENLSEKRPSLIAGDRIIAKDSYNQDAIEYEGIIHRIGAKHIYVKFAQEFHDSYNGEDMSIMVVTSRSPFRRMHQAVGLAIRNLGSSFLFPTKVVQQKPQVNFVYDQYYDHLHFEIDDDCESSILEINKKPTRTEKALAALKKHAMEQQKNVNNDNENSPTGFSEAEHVKSQLLLDPPKDNNNKSKKHSKVEFPNRTQTPLKLEWYNRKLNYYQKEAVRNILLGEARPLPYLIFGPPGTGKTITLVETILQILRLIPHSRLLVATPSNSAADLIALRLIDSGVLKPGDIIRLVAYRCVVEDKLSVKLIPYCATADIAREGTNLQGFNVNSNGLTLGCNSSVIGRHRITVGTCVSLGILYNMGFSKGHFTHIIVDEAGQATEPEIAIPFALLDVLAGQIILAGDPQQLGPVVISKLSAAYGLEETYLDRMLSRFPYVRDSQGFPDTGGYDPRLVTRLIYNYRSLPNVLKLSSDLFYDGQLVATISPIKSKEANLLNSVKEILPCQNNNSIPPSVVFHGVIGENYQTPDCPSWFNPNEASQIFYYVNELYRLGLKHTDIGIISPYIKQVRQIRSLLIEAEFELPKVGTVEEFQGQEFNVILLSTVRSSENFRNYDLKYKLGFISNPRRVNVAITRAQALMIIVGNPYLLCQDPHWRSVIKYCVDNGAYCGCDLTYSS
ncbi:hypothetical protein ILUMI_26254 [Ignelater luminosus]|uniref:RNA helicase n=1 Tax=Ignelater luminosus TaxID=2038154 RepID=A0A8K0CA45_IGNLU|nr:hypothetical protein ILUMI_26254 [Ignelater luminosus]